MPGFPVFRSSGAWMVEELRLLGQMVLGFTVLGFIVLKCKVLVCLWSWGLGCHVCLVVVRLHVLACVVLGLREFSSGFPGNPTSRKNFKALNRSEFQTEGCGFRG